MTEAHPPVRGPWLRRHLGAVLLAGTALGGLAAIPVLAAPEVPVQTPTTTTLTPPPINQGAAMTERLPSFVGLVKQVEPAVVSVTNYLKPSANFDEGAPQQGPALPFPFNQFGAPGGGQAPQAHAMEARGSGFIVNPDGLIITNNHVVKDARRVEITMSGGEKMTAKVIGTDPRTDIAVLKVEASHPLPYLKLGHSADVEPGQWVIAIGNPFGLSESVTAGIVSAVGRNIGSGPYDQFIQVDAPINRGNSGGPLITQDGKVIGMNTAILSPSGGSIGIGFAIPSDTIQRISADLESAGHVTRGYLGVEAQPVSDAMSKALGLSTAGGALVAAVQPNTPASHAGVQPGDVIRTVNGSAIKDPGGLAVSIAAIKPGEPAHLDIIRDGKQETLDVKVAELPNEQQVAQGGGQSQHEHEQKLGLALGPVSPDLAKQLELPNDTSGAVVMQVKPGSPAEQAGIQPGDVIVGVGTHAVQSPSQASKAIGDALGHDSKALALRIIRNGQPAFVAVNLNPNAESGNG
ncbi:MAG: Do family serine endopeptidase [Acetobacteraceae bacterium]